MKRKLFWFVLTIAVLAYTLTSKAETIDDLYQAVASVTAQDAPSREIAIKNAFAQVLIKVSGSKNIDQDQLVSAQRFVEQYRYQNTVVDNLAVKVLWVKFDKTTVDRYLVERGFTVWDAARPSILAWIAVDEAGVRALTDDGQRQRALDKIGQARGIHFLLPLMDLEDQQNVLFSDVWGDFEAAIKQGSVRYDPDGVLVGRVQQSADQSWSSRWTLYVQDAPLHWENTAPDLSSVIQQGADKSIDMLSRQPTQTVVNTRVLGGPDIVITDIRSLTDYTRVMNYLTQLPQIEHLYPLEILDNQIKFKVTFSGDPDALIKAVQVSDVLEYVPSDGNQAIIFSLTP